MAIKVTAIASRRLTAYDKWASVCTLSVGHSNSHLRKESVNLLLGIQIYHHRAILLIHRHIPEPPHLMNLDPIQPAEENTANLVRGHLVIYPIDPHGIPLLSVQRSPIKVCSEPSVVPPYLIDIVAMKEKPITTVPL